MDTLEINVIAIFVGVLLARLIIIWIFTLRYYVESKVEIDIDESEKDNNKFKAELLGTIVSTGIIGIIIIIIIEFKRNELS